jgi:hypothetical protein
MISGKSAFINIFVPFHALEMPSSYRSATKNYHGSQKRNIQIRINESIARFI